MLRRLDAALANWEKRLCDALWTDLHKSPKEAYLTEISIVRGEIRSHLPTSANGCVPNAVRRR